MSDASQFMGRVSKIEFTGSGTTTAPAWAVYVEIWGCPSGGGGAGGASAATDSFATGGSSGEALLGKRRPVTAGETITVTIGAAGTAGPAATAGGNASNTTIAAGTTGWTETMRGGYGGSALITSAAMSLNESDAPGYESNAATRYGANGVAPSGVVAPAYACGRPGFTGQTYATWEPSCSSGYSHGARGTASGSYRGGGPGAASPFGVGGVGGNGNGAGTGSVGVTPASGYGGGGGGGGASNGTGGAGGAGKLGYVLLIFFG